MSLIVPCCLLFHLSLLTSVFSIYQIAASFSFSLSYSLCLFLWKSSQPLPVYHYAAHLGAGVHLLECLLITDKLFGLILESRLAIRMVYLILVLSEANHFYVIKNDSHWSVFNLYSFPKLSGCRVGCYLLVLVCLNVSYMHFPR